MNEKKNFTGTKTNSQVNSMSMPDNSGAHDDSYEKGRFGKKKSEKLSLDTSSYKPAKSRQQLYNELKQEEAILDQDIYQYASYTDRAIALVIDLGFIFLLYKMVIFITPYIFKMSLSMMDKYNVEFMLGNGFLLRMILILTSVITIFLAIIMPMAFFNNSFGKKMTNLKVRGDEKYTLTVYEAIGRELIMKPISMACIVGFILPFNNKERKSLHDRIMKTLVIKG